MGEEQGIAQGSRAGRRSSRRVEARERARLQAAQYIAEEEARMRIAAEYLLLQEDLERGRKTAEERLARVRAELEAPLAALCKRAEALVLKLLETGVTQAEAAGRLGVPLQDVRRIKREHAQRAAERPTPLPPGEHHGRLGNSSAHDGLVALPGQGSALEQA